VTHPHTCVVQMFIAVAWQRARRGVAMRDEAGWGEVRLGNTRQSSAQHGENTASSTVA
jgi:hypothetical protein